MKSKLLLQLILIALFFTSCYDKDRTLYYETYGGKIYISSPDIERESYSLFKGCYAIELKKGTTTLKDFFRNERSLRSVKIPSCINNIEAYAFEGCVNLQHIELPENIQSIGRNAFKGCRGLFEFKIPPKVKNLEYYLFDNCTNLKKVILPEGLKEIKAAAFSGCSRLDSIILPKSLTSIEYLAFEACLSLHSITLPSNCSNISDKAFKGCSNLKSATIECGKIGTYFHDIASLKDITISNPNSISFIAKDAFVGTKWYEKQPNGLVYYNNLLLGYKGDEMPDSVIIKEGCNKIPDGVFASSKNIKYVETSSTITELPNSLFAGCDSLREVKLHENLNKIGNYAFRYCTSMKSIELPCSLTSIGKHAFDSCVNLTEIVLPNTINEIKEGTFSGCSNLVQIELPDTITNIGDYAFSGCEKIESIKIPNGVTIISEAMFKGCKNLKKVELPTTVREIKNNAFDGCSNLVQINLSDSIANIGNLAFQECNKLNWKLRADIRIKSIKNGKVLYSGLQATTPYIVYLDGDSIYCEKYYSSKTENELIYKESGEFVVVKQWLESTNEVLRYKQEKDTLSPYGKLNKEEIFCKNKCVAFTVGSSDYITNIDFPGILYEVDGLGKDEDDINPYIYERGETLWELPGFYNTLDNYDANACCYFNRGGGIPDFSYTLFLDKKGNIKKQKTLIEIDGKDIPISHIGTSKMTSHYINVIKDLIVQHEPIPQMIPKNISLLDLYNDCKNEAKEERHKGTLYSFYVTINKIELSSSYKYRLICENEYGSWFFGNKELVDANLYTNDVSFADLSLPAQVKVRGYFDGTSWFGSALNFVNCELLSY